VRIVSGKFKSRRINAPGNIPVRPTTDFAKESIFNILNNHFDFEDLDVLDLFCGIGGITFEFASRGVKEIISIDNNPRCTEFIKKTAAEFGIENLKVIKNNAFSFLGFCTKQFDIIFADPPYDSEGIDKIPDLVFEKNLLKANGWLILEHSEKIKFIKHPNFKEHRKYGKVNFSIFAI
jgi:16S rRNA (guanine(966)-N(2))-methyltransferase RsmD